MMEVEKPWEFKEEVSIMEEEDEEDDTGALHTRTRERKNKVADDHGEPNSFNAEEAAAAAAQEEEEARLLRNQEEQKQSVFFDSANGLWKCRHCDWTYLLSSPCRDDILNQHQGYCQIARNLELLVPNEPFYYPSGKEQNYTKVGQSGCKNENDNGSTDGKDLEKEENFDAQENKENARNDKLENGSHSNGVQEASSISETTADRDAGPKLIATMGDSTTTLDISNKITNRTQVHEIEIEKDENDTKSKVDVDEYDLEKILDEQESHDLYCPNCKSCITRRVILRKRKRTVRQALRDEPPKKTQILEPSPDVSNQVSDERDDQDAHAPEVFRCLSCFTFFIPTGCRFNIFRIFERRGMNQQVQVQHPPSSHEPDNCGSWLLSCFQTVDSPKRPAEADPAKEPLLSDPQNTDDKIVLVDDSIASAHINATNDKKEQSKIPSPAGSSSTVQITSASSSAAVYTSSSITITSLSKTEIMQTEARQMGTGQQDLGQFPKKKQDLGHQEQVPPSGPASSDALTNAIPLDHKDVPQNTKANSSGGASFFNQEFFRSGIKFPNAIPNKVLPEVNNLLSHETTPVIPPPVQSEPRPDVRVSIIPDDVLPTPAPAPVQRDEWDILKAIVYGGLVESITSLSLVSAAAASGAKTLDIFILGIANLIGGLPIIFHNIADLRNLGDANENDERVGHYWLHLGRRSKYRLHMVIAVLSYIVFGLLPPVIYGLSFRKSDNRENKMMVVAAASLACVALLAIAKAHVKRPRTYFTTLLYYLSMGLSASGLSYVAGVLITRLLAHFGLIDQGGSAPSAAPSPPGLLLPDAMGTAATAWASY